MEQKPDFFSKLKKSKIKLHLGEKSYKVPVLTLVLIAATVLVLIAALLILLLGGSNNTPAKPDTLVPSPADSPAPSFVPTHAPTKVPESQEPTHEPPATNPPAAGFKPLEKGVDDPLVAVMQQRLIDLYYMVYPDEVNGVKVTTTKFGGITEAALKAFQNRNGLTASGKLDQETYDKLISEKPAAYIMHKGDSLDIIKQVQKILIEKGYLEGTADGTCGDKTIEAIKKFQEAKGLTADGQAGPGTFKAILGY